MPELGIHYKILMVVHHQKKLTSLSKKLMTSIVVMVLLEEYCKHFQQFQLIVLNLMREVWYGLAIHVIIPTIVKYRIILSHMRLKYYLRAVPVMNVLIMVLPTSAWIPVLTMSPLTICL